MAKKSTATRASSRKSAAKKPAVKKQTKKSSEVPFIPEWKSMFVIAEHWKSDLSFFLDEMNFFKMLIDKYFLSLIDEKHINGTRHLAAGLSQFEKKRHGLENEVTSHLTQLADLIQNPFAHDSQVSVGLHQKLEGSIMDFVKNFRSLKKEVFLLAEGAMESEKAKHLLGN